MRLLTSCCAILFASLPAFALAGSHPECRDIYRSYSNLRGYHALFADYVCEGRVFLNHGSFDRAAARFKAAMELPHPEQSGFEVWPMLATAWCKSDRRDEARALLRDFSCALKVYQGQKDCFPKEGTDAEFARSRCFHAMCRERFAAHYGPFSGAPPNWFIALRQQAIIAHASCKFSLPDGEQ